NRAASRGQLFHGLERKRERAVRQNPNRSSASRGVDYEAAGSAGGVVVPPPIRPPSSAARLSAEPVLGAGSAGSAGVSSATSDGSAGGVVVPPPIRPPSSAARLSAEPVLEAGSA